MEQIQKPYANQNEAKVVAKPDQMKITDLNADCLEHIFKYLSLKDLLNVTDSRKSFREGVDQAFTSKYGMRDVVINISKFRPYEKIDESGDEIRIRDFIIALKFLRCFGKLVFNLEIEYYNPQRDRRLELGHYLTDHCAETLKELTFLDVMKSAITGQNQTFTNVRKLRIRGEFGRGLPEFNQCFPNLQHLSLVYTRSPTHSQCIEVHLPQLIHLEIDDLNSVFQLENVSNCFRLNPQLQTLRVCNDDNLPSILKSASELLQLEELHIVPYGFLFENMKEVVHFKNIRNFGLGGRLPSKIPLSFDKIEQVSLKLNGVPSIHGVKQFICLHPSVKKIDINAWILNITEDLKQELIETWSFGHEWCASFKFGKRTHNMEFNRKN